ncbi:MAG: putative DNA binding domain-containing protein [Sphaerochaeta sp.]|nr:putative DNA binding domain-containing protein [Sphaerochaeta sp.]
MISECQNIEIKQSWHDDYLKWICGFANAQGGCIYIGKDDTGHITGLKNANKLMEDLPNKIRDQLGLMPHINLLHEYGKAYLEIIVEPSTVPIPLRGSYYWRSGSVKQELKGNALTEFLLKKIGMTWDRIVEENATLEDIDDVTIELFKKEAVKAGRLSDISDLSTKELLKKLRLLTEKGLTKASLVLFGKDPGEFYPNLFVKIGRFGTSVVDMRFQEVVEGNLFQMLHDVMEQLEKKFLIKPVHFEGLRRIEELEYPVPALREMLLNALVHRNYMGSMTQLKVMDDRLSLWNAGTLPVELTVEKLFSLHESYPRNPLIADICYKAGYIDSWGRGIKKIMDTCKQAGLPEPIFEERSGGVAVELLKLQACEKIVSGGDRDDFGTLSERIRKEFGSEPVKAFEIICKHPEFTAEQIAERLDKTPRTAENYISKLKKAGFIVRRGPKLGGYWEIKD